MGPTWQTLPTSWSWLTRGQQRASPVLDLNEEGDEGDGLDGLAKNLESS